MNRLIARFFRVQRGGLAFGRVVLALWLLIGVAGAQETPAETEMTLTLLDELILRIDENAQREGNIWTLNYEELPVYIIADDSADRMRIMVPILESAELQQAQLYRILQANFESALDARYAIAQGVLWSAYLHPLKTLSDVQFFSGLAQTLNLMSTFGGSYSSGALLFQGGDGVEEKELQERSDDILRRGLNI